MNWVILRHCILRSYSSIVTHVYIYIYITYVSHTYMLWKQNLQTGVNALYRTAHWQEGFGASDHFPLSKCCCFPFSWEARCSLEHRVCGLGSVLARENQGVNGCMFFFLSLNFFRNQICQNQVKHIPYHWIFFLRSKLTWKRFRVLLWLPYWKHAVLVWIRAWRTGSMLGLERFCKCDLQPWIVGSDAYFRMNH